MVREIDIHPCTKDDLARLRAMGTAPHEMARHEQKFANQPHVGTFFLAWRDEAFFGIATLLRHSKYESVRERLGALPEINDLQAWPPGQGIGTAIIENLEGEARQAGATAIGLAVELKNSRAQSLYERLGYVEWGYGTVIDRWHELDDEGNETTEHVEECHYLVKPLA